MAADPGTSLCPRCGRPSPLRLYQNQVCAACQSADAWSRHEKLVINHDDIAAAERRRGRIATFPVVPVAVVATSLAATAVAALAVAGLFRAQPLAGLDTLVAALEGVAREAMLWGAASLAIGLFGLHRLRRSRHGSRPAWVASPLIASAAGLFAAVLGGLQWFGGGLGGDWSHRTMPPFAAGVEQSVHFARVAEATVVILATGTDRDARGTGIGMGALIARAPDRAWAVTCSHVVITDIATTAIRRAEDAPPVWVQLYDGRSAMAKVVWVAPPPLDVAVVEIPVANPPEPVTVASGTAEIDAGAAVLYVPNPYRRGWLIHHGTVERRRSHQTGVGDYSLLFTDLPVVPGDSGSGLFNGRGMLVGINTWSRMGRGEPRGISLPAETLRTLVETVETGQFGALDQRLLPMESSQ